MRDKLNHYLFTASTWRTCGWIW